MQIMRCQRCGKGLSPLRQLTDREFCCDEHRRRGPLASASAIRDLEYHGDPVYLESNKDEQRSSARAGASLGLILLFVGGLLLAGRYWLPGMGSEPAAQAAEDSRPFIETGKGPAPRFADGVIAWLEHKLPGEKPLRARSDFSGGLDDWTALRPAARPWQVKEGEVLPGGLRIWKPTMDKADYDVRFKASIEKKALAWAYRATDEANYYSSKILLTRPGQVSGASLLRTVVAAGREQARNELPLPVILQTGHPYEVTVTARGSRFATYVDGHLVDEWRDGLLSKGGFGFLSSDDEQAAVQWVAFRERKGLLSSVFASMFFLPPGMLP